MFEQLSLFWREGCMSLAYSECLIFTPLNDRRFCVEDSWWCASVTLTSLCCPAVSILALKHLIVFADASVSVLKGNLSTFKCCGYWVLHTFVQNKNDKVSFISVILTGWFKKDSLTFITQKLFTLVIVFSRLHHHNTDGNMDSHFIPEKESAYLAQRTW